ncbi:MAG: helix-turn-helix transcriptional regulator [Bdellovibrio sp.]
MRKTGEILRKAREEKGLSLHEIGLSLKISSKVLKAIEEGDETHLPAKTFLRGFVQSYANYLHLDAEKVLEVFYDEMGSTKPKPYIRPVETSGKVSQSTEENGAAPGATEAASEPVSAPPPSRARQSNELRSLNSNKNHKTIIITVIGIVLVALIIFTKNMINKYSKEAEVPSSEVEQTLEGATPVVTDPSVATNPLTDLSTPPALTPAATPITSEEPKSAPTPEASVTPSPKPSPVASPMASPSPSPTVKPTVVASSSPAPSPTTTPSPSPKPSPVASPSPTTSPSPGKPVELIVEALDNVEIEYSAPNGRPQKIRLTADQVHTFKSRSGLKINFSNGGAVNLIMNGKELGIPGDLGKPVQLSY